MVRLVLAMLAMVSLVACGSLGVEVGTNSDLNGNSNSTHIKKTKIDDDVRDDDNGGGDDDDDGNGDDNGDGDDDSDDDGDDGNNGDGTFGDLDGDNRWDDPYSLPFCRPRTPRGDDLNGDGIPDCLFGYLVPDVNTCEAIIGPWLWYCDVEIPGEFQGWICCGPV